MNWNYYPPRNNNKSTTNWKEWRVQASQAMVFLTSKGRSQFKVHSAPAGLGEERTTREGRMDGHRRGGDTDEAACFASADRRGRRRVRAHLLRYMGWAAGETVLSVRMNYALGLLCTVCFRVDFLSVFFFETSYPSFEERKKRL